MLKVGHSFFHSKMCSSSSNSNVLHDFMAGCMGGAAGVLSGYPLDTIKVRLQTQSTNSPLYRGTIHCFHCIVCSEGPSALYKGMSSPLASLALVNALVFGVHGKVAKQFHDQRALSTHFIAGAAAGAGQAFIASPMELLKLRAQLHPSTNGPPAQSPIQLLRQIVRQKGIAHLNRGLLATQIRDCPAMGVYFASFEYFGRKMSRTNSIDGLSNCQLLLAGGGAGMLSWLANYPADVIKTRFQADDSYINYREVIKRTYMEGGVRTFYAGLGSTLARAFPTNAATFFAVEWTYRLFLRRPSPSDAHSTRAAVLICQYDDHLAIAASLMLFPEGGCTFHEAIL